MFDLSEKKAIVTGLARGLGYAMAEGLCEVGVEVCILDISSNLEDAVQSLRQKGFKVHGLQADLSNLSELKTTFENALKKMNGKIDILVNNAGIHKPMPALELPVKEFSKILDVNVTVVFELARYAAEEMSKYGEGKIINIASVLATQGGFNASAYSTSKGAVALLTKSLSNEWASKGINVNAIAPGYFTTELNNHILNDPERLDSLVSRIPKGRFGNPEELKGIIQFLSSNKASYVSGAVIPIDGGFLGR